MAVVRLSWYLCGVFLVGALLSSVITVMPEDELALGVFSGLILVGSLLFGGLAIYLARRYGKGPDGDAAPKWLLRVLQGISVLATLLVLVVVG